MLRNKVVVILQNAKPPKSNINKAERQALKSPKENKDITILLADKGKAVVVMESQCEKRLADKEIGTITPTKLLKGRIQRNLRAIKKAGHIDPNIYNKKYTTPEMPHPVSTPYLRYTKIH